MKALITKPIRLYFDGVFLPLPLNLIEQARLLQNKQKPLDLDLKVHSNKRSINANNYCWKIISQIAEILHTSKEECYVEFLRRYGTRESISVLETASIILEREIKYWDKYGESKLQNKLFCHYHIYKGSSQFNTKEMSVLIDGIVSEAKELNIETATPAEISQLKDDWRNEE